MRTLKFRVYNKKTKSWIHGPHELFSLDGVNLFGEMVLFGELLGGNSWDDLNEIVGLQYTGLKDKNDKGIFEGDIVKRFWHTPTGTELCHTAIVEHGKFQVDDGCSEILGYRLNCLRCEWMSEHIRGMDSDVKYEVIGNIFDTPELLDKNENN